nr:uncharacterized protein CI109_001800 [Kwoniella shandongensis]KAA5529860.1 hypothetical protein CI109_001800 [Kwoniella shandongensis]
MPRETQGSAREAEMPGGKRKRTPSLKVVLPSPDSLHAKIDGDHEPKRLRLSLKGKVETGLPRETRDALAVVISQMAINLPPPINNILTLWLPPDFAQKEENTLGYVLKQDSLTWDQLVDIIHLFSENLLVPCQYPNPVPSRAQFHLPVPPLPPHFPSHGIYDFCAALHSLLLEVEPKGSASGFSAERWALVQKTPQGGEWFTSAVDPREVEKKKGEGSLLETMAASGTQFANAAAVSIQSALGGSTGPTLSESVIRRASLKMKRWKEVRANKQGGFGSVTRGVTTVGDTTFTPAFGPTFDSTFASGQGYYSTIQGMHEHTRHKEWQRRTLRRSRVEDTQWTGVGKGKDRETVDDILAENGEMIEELQAWQEVRVRKGVREATEREQLVAEELLASLAKLTGNVSPAEMLPASTSKTGLAHELARRFLPVSSPAIRGTLDPRRPHALHDNTTVRPKSSAIQNLGGAPSVVSPHAPPPPKGGPMAPPPAPGYSVPPPHTLPAASRHQPHRSTPPSRPPAPATNWNPAPRPGPVRPGPSNLRQSFGPGTPGVGM